MELMKVGGGWYFELLAILPYFVFLCHRGQDGSALELKGIVSRDFVPRSLILAKKKHCKNEILMS
jgi:hypothetical protein